MTFEEFLARVIDEGIEACQKSYARPDQEQKLQGSLAGFEACRGKQIGELRTLLDAAAKAAYDASYQGSDDYWYYRTTALEIEWVCNCVSAWLLAAGCTVIIRPTARGMLQAAKIVGAAAK